MRSNETSRILIVDDEHLFRRALRRLLERAGYRVSEAGSAARALQILTREPPDVVLLDHGLPDRSGLEVLLEMQRAVPRIPAVMITANGSVDGAVEAIKAGAYDYVTKPFEVDDVLRTIGRALETVHLREEVTRRREQDLHGFGIRGFVAESPAMREVSSLVRRVAASGASTVLLLGDSGVGKGMVARALHVARCPSQHPFMHITCTALPEALLESELFGHEKGAFTGAHDRKRGLLELADGGTVFLDEIGDLSPALQGKLLRFLEDRTFRRVGGAEDLRVSVRIVAATNKDLAGEVEQGRFRPDLYFRLRVIPIEIPPLREREGDIEPLLELFIAHFNGEFRKSVRGVTPAALRIIKNYPWPGNVRELRNAVERAVLLQAGDLLDERDLPRELLEAARDGRDGARPAPAETPARARFVLPPEGLVLEELERDLVCQALERTGGNCTRAARLLGMNRDQVRYRTLKFGLTSARR